MGVEVIGVGLGLIMIKDIGGWELGISKFCSCYN